MIPCSVNASWIPVKLRIDPKSDNFVHYGLPDIVTSSFVSRLPFMAGSRKITINQSLADALNSKPLESNETVVESLITPRLTPFGPLPNLKDTVSYLIGLHRTEGLTRMNSETNGWHFPFHKLRAPPLLGENATCALAMYKAGSSGSLRSTYGQDLEEEAANSNFTRVVFGAKRYGYGWGLKGPPSKLPI